LKLKMNSGSARLAKETQTLQRGWAGPFFKAARPATNQCIATAEVMLKGGHKGTKRISTIACRLSLFGLQQAAALDTSFRLTGSRRSRVRHAEC
jgi:hypothetical protein